ncbi:sugar phosphate isomerase/epimerase [Kribbella sandramycini]|uniref:Sugar phosphate isomerase/epimerase n=1 Tax=Kribbella sandramycini TaxID=60450 RepID=A0A7Y4NYL0_9ACTN|nr:sugar phosphate isomerase/epimerase family protein [Kribbella sandramycini]MBB6567442.1 sugar phosphate isomerase/epimerase [Kribbella sandramycini]NOL39948.1 sugar phosphate isomerase/epimerase [Kribbella sandramycini]
MRLGYGTNGFANHRLADALAVIADLGYDGVALTVDHNHLDPFGSGLRERTAEVGRLLERYGLSVVIETGGRYVLDPFRKHEPTLLHTDGAELRVDLLQRAIQISADLGADAVSFWSGTLPPDVEPTVGWQRLVAGCAKIASYAADRGVRLGFEPEPGMLVDDLAGYLKLQAEVGSDALGLTLDIGHLVCNEPQSPPDCIRTGAPYLVNVQIDDMRPGVHEHLEFGTGEVDFPPVFEALREIGYTGLVAVELPRHSHAAPAVARDSIDFLRKAQQ